MNSREFPVELLESCIDERIKYFEDLSFNHPRLNEIFKEVQLIAENPLDETLIFVFGPTGVGKSFIGENLEEKINEKFKDEINGDPSFIPVVNIEANAPETGNFNWKEFYIQILDGLNEPLIEKKVLIEEKEVEGFKKITFNRVNSPAALKRSLLTALEKRRTKVLIIDEAEHIANVNKSSSFKAQMDILKSLSNMSGVPIVLLGTYGLRNLMNKSDQLSKRGLDFHFSRYKYEEYIPFTRVLLDLQNHLPLKEAPVLYEHWEYFHLYTAGCIGNLKRWILSTFKYELRKNPYLENLTINDFEKYMLTTEKMQVIAKEIYENEKKINNKADESEIRNYLGFPLDDELAEPNLNKEKKKTNKNPGKRKAKRDSTKNPIENET